MNENTTEKLNWRDEAVTEIFRLFDSDSNETTLVTHFIRRHLPGAAILAFHCDRVRLLEWLSAMPGFRSLVSGHLVTTEYSALTEQLPWTRWVGLSFEGVEIEVALPPSFSQSAYCVVIAPGEHVQVLDRLLQQADEFLLRPKGRALRYAGGWEQAPDIDEEIGKVTWDDVVLPPAILAQLREAVEGFFEHKSAFESLGFAWRRGVLLVGPPGTGKTMVCKAAVAALPGAAFLYVRDLAHYSMESAIREIFERARRMAPCVLAFEDIDGLIDASNRTVFLNELDGFRSNDGILVIASSNHPSRIDEALLKRPSRFDRVFHLGLPARDERTEYCRRVLNRGSLSDKIAEGFDREALAAQVAEKTDGFTPAYLKEAFTAAALSRAQQGAVILDQAFFDAVLEQVEELKQYLKKAKNPEAMAEMRGSDDTIGFRR
jgi:AAA+ superfamily predicted ATPase